MRASVVLPLPGRAVEDRGGDAVLRDRERERRSRPDDLLLADEVVEARRSQRGSRAARRRRAGRAAASEKRSLMPKYALHGRSGGAEPLARLGQLPYDAWPRVLRDEVTALLASSSAWTPSTRRATRRARRSCCATTSSRTASSAGCSRAFPSGRTSSRASPVATRMRHVSSCCRTPTPCSPIPASGRSTRGRASSGTATCGAAARST